MSYYVPAQTSFRNYKRITHTHFHWSREAKEACMNMHATRQSEGDVMIPQELMPKLMKDGQFLNLSQVDGLTFMDNRQGEGDNWVITWQSRDDTTVRLLQEKQPRWKGPASGARKEETADDYLGRWSRASEAVFNKQRNLRARRAARETGQAQQRYEQSVTNDELGRSFREFLLDQGFHTPHPLVLGAVANWLDSIRRGLVVNIVSGLCPDYATAKQGSKRVYTFAGLNTGVGIVADGFLKRVPPLVAWIRDNGLEDQVKIHAAMGDIEAFNPANIERVHLNTADEFIDRLRGSQTAFMQKLAATGCNADGILNCCLFTELIGCVQPDSTVEERKEAWEAYVARSRAYMAMHGDFGPVPVTDRQQEQILTDRSDIYHRWYNLKLTPGHFLGAELANEVSPQDLFEMLSSKQILEMTRNRDRVRAIMRDQHIEYGAMACIGDEMEGETLFIQGDSRNQAPWWQAGAKSPRAVLHLKGEGY